MTPELRTQVVALITVHLEALEKQLDALPGAPKLQISVRIPEESLYSATYTSPQLVAVPLKPFAADVERRRILAILQKEWTGWNGLPEREFTDAHCDTIRDIYEEIEEDGDPELIRTPPSQ